ncbi:class I SAM-dependent methyltransferase [Cohnella zeiphila]|uniref:Class I SAM-dependent methyltransferase n=1 Tax=Cohnella zeiphila TaxID=2761120 RepID=A0A7X0VWK7_9BACL|nr:class I SAM-dependent methyltransferase [Cohnella zeiphila]MBB6731048.1 class I SAM-dependent methyltransferase [Cohnella zeiphila]
MGFLSVLSLAQRWAAERLEPGAAAVDATAGGGVDTLFLARACGPKGRVYAFDVQRDAVNRTRERLAAAARDSESGSGNGSIARRASGGGSAPPSLAPVELLLAGHERMAELVAPEHRGRIRAVMFNLGYLPGEGGDRSIVTRPETTVAALEAALGLLAPKGIVTAVLYPGHEGGDIEAAAVEAWAAALPSVLAQSVQYRFPQKPSAPYLIAVSKR